MHGISRGVGQIAHDQSVVGHRRTDDGEDATRLTSRWNACSTANAVPCGRPGTSPARRRCRGPGGPTRPRPRGRAAGAAPAMVSPAVSMSSSTPIRTGWVPGTGHLPRGLVHGVAATSAGAPPPGAVGDKPLLGKVAIVTGASRGIGRGLVVGLADAGADVVCAARTEVEEPGGLPGPSTTPPPRRRRRHAGPSPCAATSAAPTDIAALVARTADVIGPHRHPRQQRDGTDAGALRGDDDRDVGHVDDRRTCAASSSSARPCCRT